MNECFECFECFECGNRGELHNHHVIPKFLGGKSTIKLCIKCHGIVHSKNFMHHKCLQKAGIKRSKSLGTIFGRPKKVTGEKYEALIFDVFSGMLTKDIAKKYNCSPPHS